MEFTWRSIKRQNRLNVACYAFLQFSLFTSSLQHCIKLVWSLYQHDYVSAKQEAKLPSEVGFAKVG